MAHSTSLLPDALRPILSTLFLSLLLSCRRSSLRWHSTSDSISRVPGCPLLSLPSLVCQASPPALCFLVQMLPTAQLLSWPTLAEYSVMRSEPLSHNLLWLSLQARGNCVIRQRLDFLVVNVPWVTSFLRDSASFNRRARLALTPDRAASSWRGCFASKTASQNWAQIVLKYPSRLQKKHLGPYFIMSHEPSHIFFVVSTSSRKWSIAFIVFFISGTGWHVMLQRTTISASPLFVHVVTRLIPIRKCASVNSAVVAVIVVTILSRFLWADVRVISCADHWVSARSLLTR